jgi:tetratricopeptide (TPR) repeat protein
MPSPSKASKHKAVWWTIIVAVSLLAMAILMKSSSDTEESAEKSRADEYFLKALEFEKLTDSVGAAKNYRLAIELDPTHPEACYRLALINFANKHFDRAAVLLDRAIKRDPDNHLINYHFGLALHRVSQTDSALFYMRRTIDLEPEFALAHYSLGLMWMNLQEPDSATKYLGAYVKLMPEETQSVREVRQLIEAIDTEP